MFLTVHSATGVVIGQYISNPFIAFVIGLILHYIFDIIPHGDTKVDNKYKNPIHIALAGIIDLTVILFFFTFLLINKVDLLKPSIVMGVIGSTLPDILQAFYYVSRGKIFTRLQNFHNFWHDMISTKHDFNLPIGLIFQSIILIILTIIII